MQITVTHKSTDFDGLSSIVAATLLYPGAVAICPRNVNKNVQTFLSLHKTAYNLALDVSVQPGEVSRVVVCDCNQWQQLENADFLQQCKEAEFILWDHHQQATDMPIQRQYVEQAGATVTLLLRHIQKKGIAITPSQATLFLLGLYEDTGQLTFGGTTPEDIRTAAYLVEQGGDLEIVVNFLHVAYNDMQKKVLYRLMRSARQYQIGGKIISVGVLRLDQHVKLAAVVQLYASIVDADAVFIVFENSQGDYFVIGRSRLDEIDVRAVLSPFGCGGHAGAAAVTIKKEKGSATDIRDMILASLHTVAAQGPLVAELMSSPVMTVPPETPMHEVRDIMHDQQIRGLLVGNSSDLQGIVVLWDLKKLTLRKQWDSPVKAFMRRSVMTIGADALVREAAQLMVQKDIGHLPVTSGKEVVGIITRTDILRYLYGMV